MVDKDWKKYITPIQMSDWNAFRSSMKGKGYTMSELSAMYKRKDKKKASPRLAKRRSRSKSPSRRSRSPRGFKVVPPKSSQFAPIGTCRSVPKQKCATYCDAKAKAWRCMKRVPISKRKPVAKREKKFIGMRIPKGHKAVDPSMCKSPLKPKCSTYCDAETKKWGCMEREYA